MTITYKTKGTCSSKMTAEVEDGVIRSLQVEGGCDGNLQGISKLVVGMQVGDVIGRLEGIRWGRKATSPGPRNRLFKPTGGASGNRCTAGLFY